MGAIAVASYFYMAMVPLIQLPIMRALSTQKGRVVKSIKAVFLPVTSAPDPKPFAVILYLPKACLIVPLRDLVIMNN
jgi:oxaloacetate decarboxylase beta subunit